MKRKCLGVVSGIVLMAVAGAVPVLAAETQETEMPGAEEQRAETEGQSAETEMPETEAAETKEVILSAGSAEITVKNETGSGTLSAEAEKEEAETETSEASSVEESLWTVTFTGDDSETHIFTSVAPDGWTDAVLTENYGFWYLQYTTENGETGELEETAEAITPEEELTMWTLTDVYVREDADPEAKAIKVASLGDECKVTAVLPGWFQVEYDGASGYIRYKYLTDDKSESEAAAAQEQSARAAEEAAAAAQYYSSSGSGSSSGSSSSGKSSSGSSSSSGSGGKSSQQECLDNGLLY